MIVGLQADVQVRRGELVVKVGFEAEDGRTLAVLGPNGAGKSTLLSVIAGLLSPDRGTVACGARVLTRVGVAGPDVAIPPEQRRIGLMAQDPLLFPHLSARENVAFGLRSQRVPRVQAQQDAELWLKRMGIADMADRRPDRLSGGQRQRVALARALAARPDLLLLDEPLGALDAATAPGIRRLLRTHLRESGVTALLVTHDVLDAAVLADRVLVLEAGEIVDSGPTAQVLTAPRSAFGAALAGLNLLVGIVQADAEADTIATIRTEPGLQLNGLTSTPVRAGDLAGAVFQPAAVAVFPSEVQGSPRNSWTAMVTSMEAGSAAIRVRTAGIAEVAADLTAAAVAELDLSVGSQVYVVVKATEVRIHPR